MFRAGWMRSGYFYLFYLRYLRNRTSTWGPWQRLP
jgi:hypothetical protein